MTTLLQQLNAKITDTHVFFLRGPLSQWVRSEFVDNHKVSFTCCEQYMMYQKALLFDDELIAGQILAEKSPAVQKRLGRAVSNFDEKEWSEHREEIVYRGNLYKFSQIDEFRVLLLSTKDRVLVEVNPKDTIWGIGLSERDDRIHDESQWRGLNLLGKTLMKVRKTLTH